MTFIETLHGWTTFYAMIGGIAATLIGLMLVAISLGMHLVSEVNKETFEIYATPNIIYFVSVVLIACVMLAPGFPQMMVAGIVGIGGLVGLLYVTPYIRVLVRSGKRAGDFNLGDWMSLVVMPFMGYVGIIIAGVLLAMNRFNVGFVALWVAAIFLLLVAVANTWGLVVWIILHGAETIERNRQAREGSTDEQSQGDGEHNHPKTP